MVTLIKLGGSLLTDKTTSKSFRRDVTIRLAHEIKQISLLLPNEHIIVGHGSGSFGHVEAEKYDTINGVRSEQDWLGFCNVGQVASELNQLVMQELLAHNVPTIHIHPSSSALTKDGQVIEMNVDTIQAALNHNLIPLVHGDVAFDETLGGTIISTETIFIYLLQHLEVDKIILLGEVDGVLDSNGTVIDKITPHSLKDIEHNLGKAVGVDVTGGMYRKVKDMVNLVKIYPQLEVIVANGTREKILTQIMSGDAYVGTQIVAK